MKPQIRTIASLIDDGSILGLQDGNHGGDHPKASEYVNDGIPFVMASDIRDCRLNLADCKRLPKERTDRLRIGFAKAGDILLTHKGTVGEVCITPVVAEYVMLTPQVTYYRVNPTKLDNRYLCAALRGRLFRQQLDQLSPQSTRPYVPISTQKGLRIEWYPTDVQRLIGRRVAAYDDLIENNTRRITILEEMARRIFEEWFVHFRAPGCEGLPMVDSEIGPMPRGWEIATLESLCSRITDGSHYSPPSVEHGPPMLSVRDMRDWGFNFSECRSISQADFDDLVRNDCRPISGDILIAKDGANLNKHTFLIDEDLDAVILSSIAILRPRPSVEREFLVATLKSDDVSKRIKNSRSGAAIPRIILKDFRRLSVILPPHPLRARFEKAVEPIHKLCRLLSRSNANLRAQRDLLLPKLISGEIDVSRSAAALPEAAE